MAIRKAVLPVAGLGTRFLPATKVSPKEMLPIVDRPLIAYAVEEAIAAGIEEIIFVTAMGKRAIEDYFDRHFLLEQHLASQGRHDLLSTLKQTSPDHVCFAYVRQVHPLGLGHAILCTEHLVGKEPFVVILADDLIAHDGSETILRTMMALHETQGGHVVAYQPVPEHAVQHYGILDLLDENALSSPLLDIVEKPNLDQAPSCMAAIGRYVLCPEVFRALRAQPMGVGSELQLTDAIKASLEEVGGYGCRLQDMRFDCGSKLGYMQANVHHALRHPDIRESFAHYLRQTIDTDTNT